MILNHLLNKEVHISLADLTESFQVSERTIRNEVKYLNEDGIKNGFRIQTLRGQGYQLQIENKPLFTDYLKKQTASFDTQSVSQRLLYLELLLFQQQDFITIDQLASQLQVSRSTIQQDLKRVDTFLHTYGLLLKRKAHYGVQIVGPEKKHRAALAKLLNTSSEQLSQTEAYRSFRKTLDIQALTLFIKERVTHYQIYISDVALRNMVDHVCILAFRVSQKNYIRMTGPLEKNPIYTALSKDIAAFIEAQYHLDVPEAEQDFLAEHLIGKVTVDTISKEEKMRLQAKINDAMTAIDQQYGTTFQPDEELQNALLLHIYPLMLRLHYNLQLDNPIIEDLYTRYANVFNISISFVQYLQDNEDFIITKDEIGYVAMYFAASLEKERNQKFRMYKKIGVLCSSGAGAAYLLKMKLESAFTNAEIVTFSMYELDKLRNSDCDVVITTFPLTIDDLDIPVIETALLPGDQELARLKDTLAFSAETQTSPATDAEPLLSYFAEECFTITEANNYLDILKTRCHFLMEAGYAPPTFLDDVLERENKMTTIYQNSIAGPHPIQMGARKECIDVIILKQPAYYMDKKVRLIFLLNLDKGHLFIHKEVSRLMIRIMENDTVRKQLLACKNYAEFISILKSIL